MDKKLTLNIDEDIIDFAHQYSKKTHQSISNIVEGFFKELKGSNNDLNLSKKTNSLYGALKNSKNITKSDIRKLFHEKSLS